MLVLLGGGGAVVGMRWLGPKPVAPAASTAGGGPGVPERRAVRPAERRAERAHRCTAGRRGRYRVGGPGRPGPADRPRATHEGALAGCRGHRPTPGGALPRGGTAADPGGAAGARRVRERSEVTLR